MLDDLTWQERLFQTDGAGFFFFFFFFFNLIKRVRAQRGKTDEERSWKIGL